MDFETSELPFQPDANEPALYVIHLQPFETIFLFENTEATEYDRLVHELEKKTLSMVSDSRLESMVASYGRIGWWIKYLGFLFTKQQRGLLRNYETTPSDYQGGQKCCQGFFEGKRKK